MFNNVPPQAHVSTRNQPPHAIYLLSQNLTATSDLSQDLAISRHTYHPALLPFGLADQHVLTLNLTLEYIQLAEDECGHNDRSRYLARSRRQIAERVSEGGV